MTQARDVCHISLSSFHSLQGITTAVAMVEGLGSPLFAAALAFTAVVMYDAMGVRRHAGVCLPTCQVACPITLESDKFGPWLSWIVTQ